MTRIHRTLKTTKIRKLFQFETLVSGPTDTKRVSYPGLPPLLQVTNAIYLLSAMSDPTIVAGLSKEDRQVAEDLPHLITTRSDIGSGRSKKLPMMFPQFYEKAIPLPCRLVCRRPADPITIDTTKALSLGYVLPYLAHLADRLLFKEFRDEAARREYPSDECADYSVPQQLAIVGISLLDMFDFTTGRMNHEHPEICGAIAGRSAKEQRRIEYLQGLEQRMLRARSERDYRFLFACADVNASYKELQTFLNRSGEASVASHMISENKVATFPGNTYLAIKSKATEQNLPALFRDVYLEEVRKTINAFKSKHPGADCLVSWPLVRELRRSLERHLNDYAGFEAFCLDGRTRYQERTCYRISTVPGFTILISQETAKNSIDSIPLYGLRCPTDGHELPEPTVIPPIVD